MLFWIFGQKFQVDLCVIVKCENWIVIERCGFYVVVQGVGIWICCVVMVILKLKSFCFFIFNLAIILGVGMHF